MLFLLGEDLLQKLETEKLLRTLATDHINSIQSLRQSCLAIFGTF